MKPGVADCPDLSSASEVTGASFVIFQGGDHHPEVSGSGGSTGNVRESPNPVLHREPAETHRSGRETGGVLPGERQPATVQPLPGTVEDTVPSECRVLHERQLSRVATLNRYIS